MKNVSVQVKFKAWNLITSGILLVIGLLLVWYKTGDPILSLGILLISAAFNLRFEPDGENAKQN